MIRNPILAIGLAAAIALSASAALAQDKTANKASRTFIKNAIEGNLAEIDVGKLAQQKGTDPAVKSFGAMLVKDHGDANAKAKTAAADVNVTPPTGSSIGEKATYLKLKILSGATFDRAFAKAMVSDHQSDIKKYQKEAQKTDAVGTYAKDALPTLQKHLQEAQQLQGQLQQTTGSK